LETTVLLIERHEQLRGTLREAINRITAAKVVAFGTLPEAAAAQVTQNCELALIGLHHADLEAFRLVQKLKLSCPGRPVIGLSAPDDTQEAWLAGCDDVLEQPFGLDELRRRLDYWVSETA